MTVNSSTGFSRSLRIFLCHASGDKTAVRDLYRRLTTDGFLPWLDELDLMPGQNWQEEIPAAVRACDVVLVCLSQKSVNKEGYLQKEIREALSVAEEKPEGTIFIIPVRIEPVEVPKRLTSWQWANLFEADGYERLVRALKFRATTIHIGSNPSTATPERMTYHLTSTDAPKDQHQPSVDQSAKFVSRDRGFPQETEHERPVSFWTKIADFVPQIKTPVQLSGLALAIGGLIAIKFVMPNATKAQVSAVTIGGLFLLFGQVVAALDRIPKQQRAKLVVTAFLIFCFFAIVLIFATTIFIAQADPFTTEEHRVIDLKKQIARLIDTYQTIPTLGQASIVKVNEQAPKLGEKMLLISDSNLDRSRQILKYEYALYAYMMASSTDSSVSYKIQFATKALESSVKAKALLEDGKQLSATNKDANITTDWMIDDDEDARIDYLTAMAMCIKGMAQHDNVVITSVSSKLAEIPTPYKLRFPPNHSPELIPCLKGGS